jgi:tRNA-specific 2-thiouridylase
MQTVVVGMSGGVDSSVAAYLLKQQGYNVIGIFMHNWQEEIGGHCCAEEDYEDVKRVCAKLDIPYYTVNYSKEYYEKVFKRFLEEYEKGRTPNPDVLCNREIKFGPFLEHALRLGADYIATGHYAGVERKDGFSYLVKAADKDKDQTYFLCQLTQEQLSRALFPLENMQKSQVRQLARNLGLSTAEKKDSTGICFIGERRFRHFLANFLPARKGDILTSCGKKVGEHEGVMFYTLGQRRGLGIGGVKDGGEGRWFVYDKDVKNNILYVEQGSEEKLYSRGLMCEEVNWIPQRPKESEFLCAAKVRYRQPEKKCHVKIDGKRVYVEFFEKQRAVACGQYVVFYDGKYCIGGSCIEEVYK